jgi:excisionase family DNA binding protein
MESRDVVPSVDLAPEERQPASRQGPVITPRWLDVDAAAQYLCMTRHALYHQVARLQLPFVRHGRLLRFDRAALDRCLERKVKHGLVKRGGVWYLRKMINGRVFRESTGFADKKAAERRANEIELDIRAGVHGCKSTISSFAEWWTVYRKTYTPLKSARNRDAQIVAHFLPHFGARPLDQITKSDIVR